MIGKQSYHEGYNKLDFWMKCFDFHESTKRRGWIYPAPHQHEVGIMTRNDAQINIEHLNKGISSRFTSHRAQL